MAHRSVSSDRISARGVVVSPDFVFPGPTELVNNPEDEQMLKKIMESQESFRSFLKYPLPNYPKFTFECTITREWLPGKKSCSEPIYRLYLEKNNRRMFLLSARMDKAGYTYRITFDTDNSSQSNEYLAGQLRFSCFGSNCALDVLRPDGEEPRYLFPEESLGVHFKTNLLGLRGPRQMVVVLSAQYDLDSKKIVPTEFVPKGPNDSLLTRYHKHGCTVNSESIVVLRNVKPSWNDAQRVYQLQFNDRIRCSSVKNFMIKHPTEENQFLIQFGKSGHGTFGVNFTYPLCPITAFGIALSSIHPKTACD